jgi:hypothetical protein
MGETELQAGRYPLTSRQRDPHRLARAPEHVIALTFRIKGEIRPDCLQGALDDVVERHEALRTRITYRETDGNLGYQEVLPPLPVQLAVHDVQVAPGRSRDDVAVELLNELNDEVLPFSVTPSLRASLHRFDDHDAVLNLLIHHLYGDGWSGGILRRELLACYRARVTGIPHALPPPVQYGEFASWEQEFLQGDKAAAGRRYWAEKLTGAELCALPADRLRGPDTLAPRPAVRNFSIAPDDFAQVAASATRNRCSVWHVILAAFMVLAERASGRSDITLLTVDSGRPTRQFYDTIGFFTDLVPIRLEFGHCTSSRDLMLLARKASADARQYQVPFGMILELFPDLMKVGQDPRFVVPGLNFIGSSWARDHTRSAVTVEQVLPPDEPPGNFLRGAFKWNFRVVPPGEFRCVVEYEPDALEESTADRWGSDFISSILAIAGRPDQPWQHL